jgi:hypothetical protein
MILYMPTDLGPGLSAAMVDDVPERLAGRAGYDVRLAKGGLSQGAGCVCLARMAYGVYIAKKSGVNCDSDRTAAPGFAEGDCQIQRDQEAEMRYETGRAFSRGCRGRSRA